MVRTFTPQIAGQDVTPGAVYCVGRNYRDHARELNNPVPEQPLIFLKSPASLRGLEASEIAFSDEEFHFEVELVVCLGMARRMGEAVSIKDIAGFGLGLDMTRRTVQDQLKKKGHPWTLAKSFKGSAILGPLIPFNPDMHDLTAIEFEFSLNGAVRQVGHTEQMIFPVCDVLTYLASFNDLRPGDLIYTGTPAGVGACKRGDLFYLSISQLNYQHHGVI